MAPEEQDGRDPGPMPIPSMALIEGYPKPGNGDRHVIVLEKDGCWLYELYNRSHLKNGSWSADSTAIWGKLSRVRLGRCAAIQ